MDNEAVDFWFTFVIVFVAGEVDDGFAGGADGLLGVEAEGAGGDWVVAEA